MKTKLKLSTWVICGTLIVSIGYAALRYNVMGSIPWKDFPLFILDKGLAMAALLLLVASYGLKVLKPNSKTTAQWHKLRKDVGITGFFLAGLHTVISLVIFDVIYFSQFYSIDGSFSISGIIITAAGVLSLFIFLIHYLRHKKNVLFNNAIIKILFSKKNLLVAFGLLGLHVILIGFKGWFRPLAWFGYLPPITVLSFVFLIVVVGFRIVSKES